MEEHRRILNYINEDFDLPVRDPIWKNIYLDRGLYKIISSRPFQELHHIKQLGPAYLVYPGATHSRFSHSLGVLHSARKILSSLLVLHKNLNITLEEVKAFLCAALLHDLGHYPFAHALKDLEVEKHEKLTGRIILADPIARMIKEELGASPELTAAIVDQEMYYRGSNNLELFRNLLSGVLDPDKLDYLNRDAFFCGVPYGNQDLDFITGHLCLIMKTLPAIREEGAHTIENILFSKYMMYKSVYWHRTVRVATGMIKKAVLLGLKAGAISADDLYGLSDDRFYTLSERAPCPSFELIRSVFRRRLYQPVHSIPFNENNREHLKLEALPYRLEVEKNIARELSDHLGVPVKEEEIIIDIPEPISFEVNIRVLTQEDRFLPYTETSLFNREVVDNFVSSLRNITLMVPAKEGYIEYFEGGKAGEWF